MLKSLLNSAPVQILIAAILAAHMSLCKATTRWTIEGAAHAEPLWAARQGLIYAVWHGRILMMIKAVPRAIQPRSILISRSKEGDVVARVARLHGVGVIRGSSRNAKKAQDKGGLTAFREMVRQLAEGRSMSLTPDGPRGPRMHVGEGAIRLARVAGAPILPVAWAMSRGRVLNSWDRFILPMPFGRGAVVYGEPVRVEGGGAAALEAARAVLETRLREVSRRADALCGVAIIEPDAQAGPAPAPAPEDDASERPA